MRCYESNENIDPTRYKTPFSYETTSQSHISLYRCSAIGSLKFLSLSTRFYRVKAPLDNEA